MGLLKQARGLPKFFMECGWWRHPAWVGAGLPAIALQHCGISYAYEHETDGVLPGPGADELAEALGLNVREVRPALKVVLERGRWTQTKTGFAIVSFTEHNATAAEIREHRERRSAAGRAAAEARWRNAQTNASESDSEPHANRITGRNARAEESRAVEEPGADKPPTPRGQIFVSLVAACRIDGNTLTKDERSDVNRTVKNLFELGVTPQQIQGFPAWWRRTFPGAQLTHRCFRQHWAKYASNGNGQHREPTAADVARGTY